MGNTKPLRNQLSAFCPTCKLHTEQLRGSKRGERYCCSCTATFTLQQSRNSERTYWQSAEGASIRSRIRFLRQHGGINGEFRVGVFPHQGKTKTRYMAYTRDYNPLWSGCCEHTVEAANGTEAKVKAIETHKTSCAAAALRKGEGK